MVGWTVCLGVPHVACVCRVRAVHACVQQCLGAALHVPPAEPGLCCRLSAPCCLGIPAGVTT